MENLALAQLFVHPVKSAAGIPLRSAELDRFGLRHDRRWMVVDPAGRFLTQRKHPRMALIQPDLGRETLVLRAPGLAPLAVPLEPAPGPALPVTVWGDVVEAIDTGLEAADWLAAFMGTPCRLVHMPRSTVRPVDPRFAGPDVRVAFADGFPLLLLSDGSLAELNRRLAEPLPITRFRPNLVVSGTAPHAEDAWRRIRIGAVEFDVVKPCARCAVTTVDPATGRRGKEPLRTLATYRRIGEDVFFGQNAIHRSTGRLTVGDPVEVLDSASPRPALPA